MLLFEKAKELLHYSENEQAQDEAIIDLLYLVMLSDKAIKLSEQDFVTDYVSSLDLPSKHSWEFYINAALPKVRTALQSQEKTEALLLDISDRLKHHNLRNLALEVVQELIQVDSTIAVEESALVEKIRQRFGF
ncbi:hypothetical protein H6F76_26445 [Leptolyngbya sp. FACHB-321]|uniref:hypothetical protein n=1 Tax=Leptolyngbya sp. FACHB-321 TaxID=2692807 RepID=UPI0016896308|nr:hypothetical protein [Leptolyngbya sp. FACHB-321]MBD2038497.1 hypothetical protein [Leptolyngbya sp. FACHB-321]